MNILKKLLFSMLFVFVSNCLSANTAWANEKAAIVIVSTGDFYAVNKAQSKRKLQRRSEIYVGDTLITGNDGRSQVRFIDGAIISLRPDTKLRIDDYRYSGNKKNENSVMTLIKGGFRTITGAIGKEHYKVNSRMATIGIRGTHYEAVIQNEQMYVALWHGGVTISNDAGQVDLGLGADYNFAHVQSNNSQPTGMLDAPEVITNDSQPQIAPLASNNGGTTTTQEPVAVDLSVLATTSDDWESVAPTENMPTSGNYTYSSMTLTSSGGTAGNISNFSMIANVDFAAATIDGTMNFKDSINENWVVAFNSTAITDSKFTAVVDPTISSTQGDAVEGTISGNFLGSNAETIDGAFDVYQQGNPANNVQGTFSASQQ